MAKHKSDYLQEKTLTPADALRRLIVSLEQRHYQFETMTSTQALVLLRELDQAYHLFERLEAAGLDLSPERGRFSMIEARIRKGVAPLLKALGGPSELVEHRPIPSDRDQWWWHLDTMVADRQKQRLAWFGLVGGIVLILISVAILAFNTFLAPSPEASIAFQVERDAEVAIDEGDYRGALSTVEQGLAQLPTDATFWLYKGLLHQVLEEEEAAERAFTQSQQYVAEPFQFYLARSQLSLRLGQPGPAEADARTAIELKEKEARAWLLLGQALQEQDRGFDAAEAYERAGQLAWESGDSEVVVMARLALSRLGIAAEPQE